MSDGPTTSQANQPGPTLEHVLSNGTARFRDDELVVRLPYQRLVRNLLDEWSAQPTWNERDDVITAIGLCRIHLDAAAARSELEMQHRDWYGEAERAAREAGYVDDDTGRVHDLEIVLRCLRSSFAKDNGGWTPTVGKNREVERLQGSYVIDGGGDVQGPRPHPDYTIDGFPQLTKGSHRVALRGPSPSARARVGLVDTPMWANPWLSGAVVADPDDLLMGEGSGSAAPSPSPHATFVAGLVLRQAPAAVVELRAGLDEGASSDTWTVAQKIAALADSSVELVNLSLGCMTEDAKPPLVLSAAIDALSPRTLVVAAAGNHAGVGGGSAPPSYPAALDNVIAVGALDGDEAAAFTPDAPWVDAMAPGVDVVSTIGSSGGTAVFGTWSGTSFAAAAVSGAIAQKMREHGSLAAAWEHLRNESPVDDRGRPKIALETLRDWPSDGAGP